MWPGCPGGPGGPGGPGSPSLPPGPGKDTPGKPWSPFSPLSPGKPGGPLSPGTGKPETRTELMDTAQHQVSCRQHTLVTVNSVHGKMTMAERGTALDK